MAGVLKMTHEVLINGVRYIQAPPTLPDDTSEIERVLACPIDYENGKKTIRDYLHDLLKTLWNQGEGFSGKRPFGNSGWEWHLLTALALAGIIEGEIDTEYEDDRYVESIPPDEEKRGNKLIAQAIAYVFYGNTHA